SGWDRIGYALRIARPENFFRSNVHEIRVSLFERLDAGFDSFHFVDVFDCAFLAGGDNQALLAFHQRDLGDLLDRNEALRLAAGANVAEGAQAVVLTEIAAGALVTSGAVLDSAYCVEADECGLQTITPES